MPTYEFSTVRIVRFLYCEDRSPCARPSMVYGVSKKNLELDDDHLTLIHQKQTCWHCSSSRNTSNAPFFHHRKGKRRRMWFECKPCLGSTWPLPLASSLSKRPHSLLQTNPNRMSPSDCWSRSTSRKQTPCRQILCCLALGTVSRRTLRGKRFQSIFYRFQAVATSKHPIDSHGILLFLWFDLLQHWGACGYERLGCSILSRGSSLGWSKKKIWFLAVCEVPHLRERE